MFSSLKVVVFLGVALLPSFAAAQATAVLAGGTLQITGTNASDTVLLTSNATEVLVRFQEGGVPARFVRSSVVRINVRLLNGDDVFRGNNVRIRCTVDGGNGSDLIVGGLGADTLGGGGGRDIVAGGSGLDRVSGDGGEDILIGGGLTADAESTLKSIWFDFTKTFENRYSNLTDPTPVLLSDGEANVLIGGTVEASADLFFDNTEIDVLQDFNAEVDRSLQVVTPTL